MERMSIVVIKMKSVKNKKSQIKVKQMVFMIIAVTIILIMVGMFLLMIRMGKLKNTVSELEGQNAVLLVSKLANSPEFTCGSAFGGKRSNCVDYDKLGVLKDNIWKYEDFWGVKNVELMVLYPAGIFRGIESESIVLVEGPVTGKSTSSFVTVCKKQILNNKIQNVCTLGRLFVWYENVQ
jgi:hypothetical protein